MFTFHNVDKLDVDKLVPIPADLSKLCDIVKYVFAKKDLYNANQKCWRKNTWYY